MSSSTGVDDALRWDPWSTEIFNDPHPTYRRLRNEAPLYHNAEHDFWVVSRYEDVESGLKDAITYSSAKGNILELIQADVALPPGSSPRGRSPRSSPRSARSALPHSIRSSARGASISSPTSVRRCRSR